MKQITLSHITALTALRHLRITSQEFINYVNNCLINKISTPNKIEIIETNRNKVNNSKYIKCHYMRNKLLSKYTISLNNTIKVTCPELTIIHMASIINYYELALLIHEFCGSFSIVKNGEYSFIGNLEPITNIDKIKKFIQIYTRNNKRTPGIRNLKSILSFAENNSASPMESRLFIKLCGPRFRGMYGCKNLKMNQPVKISNSAKQIAGQELIVPDISSFKYKLAIEYDSNQFHETTEQGQKDKRRRDALVNDG